MSFTPPVGRIVDVYVKDARGHALPDAEISFSLNGQSAGKVDDANGHASIRLPDRVDVVAISVTFGEETKTVTLAQEQDHLTVVFDVNYLGGFMEKHLPLVVGIAFILIALFLGFSHDNPSPLQSRLILGTWALAAGAFATEITGMLRVQLNFGKRVAIGATGAMAVFVILYLLKPA